MGDILDRIDWDHYRRTRQATMQSGRSRHTEAPSTLHDKYAIKDNEIEFVKLCQMIDMFDRHDDHLIMKQRIKQLNGEARQSGIDAFEW